MNRWPVLIAWVLTAILGLAVAAWIFPRAFAFYPRTWNITRQQAVELALARFSELGEAVEDPYVAAELTDNIGLEMLLLNSAATADPDVLRESLLGKRIVGWRVTVYEPGAPPNQWTYRTAISFAGELSSLELRVPPEEAGEPPDPSRARGRADEFLRSSGFDLADFDEPTLRRTDRLARTDLSFRYQDRQALLGPDVPYGVEVTFAGDRLTGFGPWLENPRQRALERSLQPTTLLTNAWFMMPYLLFPWTAFFFLRLYHAGEIGVRRAVQVLSVVFLAGAATILLTAKAATEGNNFGALSRALVPWAWGFQITVLWFSALGLIAALSWSVGEARCREHWGQKLAAFDALFQRRWNNATVGRSALRGLAAATVLAAILLLMLLALRPVGVWSGLSMLFGPWWQHAAWPGITLILFTLATGLYAELFAWLFLLPVAVRHLGIWPGALAVAVFTAAMFWPPLLPDPTWWFLIFGLVRALVLVGLFLRYDLLTTLLASIGSTMVITGLPFLLAQHLFLQLQGALPLLAVALPLLLSVRHLRSEQEFIYRYDDVPAHVRRIADRERQRVELETARRIQSSILPQLPPQIAGVDIAYCYLPATEVGGDFYDVLALEDGRLAVAVGDVAGHGVSSGLIMSMAKSTLALQVTVNPEVEAVFDTLNRLVFQSARLRLLTTLCYVLVDRRNHELTYASAGHIAPYRVDAGGRVEGLSSSSYPLGVREDLDLYSRTLPLESGDRLFMFSDGVVEARREGSEDLFGFDRLEESLRRHAAQPPTGLRDGVLEDLRQFTGAGPQEDDLTIVVLRIP